MAINLEVVLNKLEEFNSQPVRSDTITQIKGLVNYDDNKFKNLEILELTLRKECCDTLLLTRVLDIFSKYKSVIVAYNLCSVKLWLYIHSGLTVNDLLNIETRTSIDRITRELNSAHDVVLENPVGDTLSYVINSSKLVRS